jgi:hypothetical protein
MTKLSRQDPTRRYSDNWQERKRAIRRSTFGICTWCWHRPAAEVHHWQYIDLMGKIAGREMGGIHATGLCQKCHGVAHRKTNWHQDRRDPLLHSHNYAGYKATAQLRHWLLWLGLRLGIVGVLAAAYVFALPGLLVMIGVGFILATRKRRKRVR